MSDPLTIRAGALLDVDSGSLEPNVLVVLRDGLVEKVDGRHRGRPDIDLPDCTLLPGLIDGHLHFGTDAADLQMSLLKDTPARAAINAVADAARTLDAGVTTVRLMGMVKGFLDLALRDAIAEGLVAGPRVLACGQMISTTGGHGELIISSPEHSIESWATIVDGADGARKGARTLIRRRVDFLKISASGGMSSPADEMSSRQLTVAEIQACVEEAAAVGIQVAAHAQGIAGIRTALEGGVSSIEHGFFLDEEAAQQMARSDVYLVPTLSVPHAFVERGKRGQLPDYAYRKARAALQASRRAFTIALKAHVPIVMGSDNGFRELHGQASVSELAHMVSAGMSAIDAIRSATSVAARYLRLEGLGRIASGQRADLIAVEGNPIEDIEALRRVRLVVKDGHVVSQPIQPLGAVR